MPPDLSRVVVVGTSCSGKTTLARRLAGILGAQHVELDALYWGREWTPRLDFPKAVSAAVQQERWVIDGNYSAVRDLIWRRCTAIVWLDYSFARVFSRALRRTARRVVTGERLYGGNPETIRNALFDRDGILWWVVRTHAKRRREFLELLRRSEYRHSTLIQFQTPAAAEAFLSEESDCRISRDAAASGRPVFGKVPAGVTCHERLAAYVVVSAADSRVAVVRAVVDGRTRFWLPGGETPPGESPEATAAREVREELGRAVRLAGRIGDAVQFFYAGNEGRWYEMRAIFFRAEFEGEPLGIGSDELHWVDARLDGESFFHACHAWAACQA
jgi:adenylate kinase family enzyme/8-oxo-dGTP pyrophosphatase MutT (NUDIX family)